MSCKKELSVFLSLLIVTSIVTLVDSNNYVNNKNLEFTTQAMTVAEIWRFRTGGMIGKSSPNFIDLDSDGFYDAHHSQ